jgi:hypothetical protein
MQQSSHGELWCYEVILLPSCVIERSYVRITNVSRDLAKQMFVKRYERGDYPSAAHPQKPDAIRFLDRNGTELLRFTADDYLKERTAH